MLIYFTGWLMILSLALFNYFREIKALKLYIYLILIYIAFIAFIRGYVGTDTVMYQDIVLYPEQFLNVGWLYSFINYILYYLTENAVIVVRFISLMIVLLFAIAVHKSNKNQLLILLTFIFPWLFQLSMNIMRSGIAIGFITIAVIYLSHNRKSFIGWLALLLAPLFHISAVIFYFFIFLFFYQYFIDVFKLYVKKKYFLGMIGVMIIIYGLMIYFNYHNHVNVVQKKLELYANFHIPSVYSGVSKVLLVSILLFGIWIDSNFSSKFKQHYIISFGLGLCGTFIISRFTYAGLRLLDIVYISAVLVLLFYYRKLSCNISKSFMKLSIVIILFSTIFFTRNFINSANHYDTFGQGTALQSPFVPYKTLFSVKGDK